MPLNIKKVLVCDAVDKSCVELLEQHGINVSFPSPWRDKRLCANCAKAYTHTSALKYSALSF